MADAVAASVLLACLSWCVLHAETPGEGEPLDKPQGPVPPRHVVWLSPGRGVIENAESLCSNGKASCVVTVPPEATAFAAAKLSAPPLLEGKARRDWLTRTLHERRQELMSATPALLLDFGQTQHGQFAVRSASASPIEVIVQLGESAGEAINEPFLGPQRLLVPARGEAKVQPTAFRYALVYFIATDGKAGKAAIESCVCLPIFHPVTWLGSFECSDPLLNRIWQVGAYTTHLCMQDEIWDGAKRDRIAWMGDLLVQAQVARCVFAEQGLVRKSMERLYADTLQGQPSPQRHVNGLPTYSCAWVIGLADDYRATGDASYLASRRDALVKMLDFLEGELDGNGIFDNRRKGWVFIDWSTDIAYLETFTPDQKAGGHLFILWAAREGAWLLRQMNDPEAARFEAWADALEQAARERLLDKQQGTFGERQQVNALGVLADAFTPEEARAVCRDVLTRPYEDIPGTPPGLFSHYRVTPYGNFYIIEAMARAGQYEPALALIRSYWGEMLNRDATTWWEHFDSRDEPRNKGAIPGVGTDWHSCYAYGISLCHGWGSGPTAWLMRHVLGVSPAKAGRATINITPRLCDLSWAGGTVPCLAGKNGKPSLLTLKHTQGTGSFTTELDLPEGIEATVGMPLLAGKAVYLNGQPAEVRSRDQEFSYVRLARPGKYRLEVK